MYCAGKNGDKYCYYRAGKYLDLSLTLIIENRRLTWNPISQTFLLVLLLGVASLFLLLVLVVNFYFWSSVVCYWTLCRWHSFPSMDSISWLSSVVCNICILMVVFIKKFKFQSFKCLLFQLLLLYQVFCCHPSFYLPYFFKCYPVKLSCFDVCSLLQSAHFKTKKIKIWIVNVWLL